MKKLFPIFLVAILVSLSATYSFAAGVDPGENANSLVDKVGDIFGKIGDWFGEMGSKFVPSLTGTVAELPIYSTFFPGSMGAYLCDIRCMFTGPLGTVILATAIFIMGVTILIGKFKWPMAILIVCVAVIFLKAEILTTAIMDQGFLGSIGGVQIMSFVPQMCYCVGSGLMNAI